jgi:hypothetical protein
MWHVLFGDFLLLTKMSVGIEDEHRACCGGSRKRRTKVGTKRKKKTAPLTCPYDCSTENIIEVMPIITRSGASDNGTRSKENNKRTSSPQSIKKQTSRGRRSPLLLPLRFSYLNCQIDLDWLLSATEFNSTKNTTVKPANVNELWPDGKLNCASCTTDRSVCRQCAISPGAPGMVWARYESKLPEMRASLSMSECKSES